MITSTHSTIDFRRRALPQHLDPLLFLGAFGFSLPIDFGLVARGCRPLFDYLLSIRSKIRKTRITAESIFDLLLSLIFGLQFLKRTVAPVDRRIGPWSWDFRRSLINNLT